MRRELSRNASGLKYDRFIARARPFAQTCEESANELIENGSPGGFNCHHRGGDGAERQGKSRKEGLAVALPMRPVRFGCDVSSLAGRARPLSPTILRSDNLKFGAGVQHGTMAMTSTAMAVVVA